METQRDRENPTISLPIEDRSVHVLPLRPTPPSFSITSPSHDFCFTIPLHVPDLPSQPLKIDSITKNYTKPTTAAIDLSPADDIFLHGHLLPLDVLTAARSSADLSIDRVGSDLSIKYNSTVHRRPIHNNSNNSKNERCNSSKEKAKHKSLPSFFGLNMWKKENNSNMEENCKDDKKKAKKKGLDFGHIIKKCACMVEQLFISKGEKERRNMRRRPHSFSGHSNPRAEWERWRRRRGQRSAPASLRTSPANSGHLSVSSVKVSTSDESTMEELQNAIQAAIAHCKNSIAAVKEEKCKG